MDSVKTVGREPTEEMLTAGRDHAVPATQSIGAIWRAMWDKAAASPPAGAEVRVKPLVWSEHSPPNDKCPYDHVTAPSAIGEFSIEWKSWKDYDSYAVYVDGELIGSGHDLTDAKAVGSAYLDRTILSALAPTPSTDAVRRQAREEWNFDMAVAPRDGRMLLLYNASSREQAVMGWTIPTPGDEMFEIMPEGFWSDIGGRNAAISVCYNPLYFQAWQPLPEPPALSTPPAGAAALNEGEEP